MLTADENQANGGGGNQQNIGSHANISGVVAQNVGGNAQVGGKGAQFGGKRKMRKFWIFMQIRHEVCNNISKISEVTE